MITKKRKRKMFENMGACRAAGGSAPDCSTMIKGMTETIKNMTCREPVAEKSE